jgi:glycine/serine hydroxymethyltransferase
LDLEFEKATTLCHALELHGIFIDIAGRLGVAEITHMGMKASDMEFIAHAISQVFANKVQDDLNLKIREFVKQFEK